MQQDVETSQIILKQHYELNLHKPHLNAERLIISRQFLIEKQSLLENIEIDQSNTNPTK